MLATIIRPNIPPAAQLHPREDSYVTHTVAAIATDLASGGVVRHVGQDGAVYYNVAVTGCTVDGCEDPGEIADAAEVLEFVAAELKAAQAGHR